MGTFASHLWDWMLDSCLHPVCVELACSPYASEVSSPSLKTCGVDPLCPHRVQAPCNHRRSGTELDGWMDGCLHLIMWFFRLTLAITGVTLLVVLTTIVGFLPNGR